jgi:hypothetical protein
LNNNVSRLSYVTDIFTHLFLCSSREGGLESRIDNSIKAKWVIWPGGKIVPLAHEGRKILRSHRNPKDVTVIFTAGIPDLSEKINDYKHHYTETLYTEAPETTLDRISHLISQAIYILRPATTDIIFSTIAPIDLETWNLSQLRKKRTTHLLYQHEYDFMNSNLKQAIISMNNFIKSINTSNKMITSYLDSAVQKYYKNGNYRYFLGRLHDGVHGGEGVKVIWGRLLNKCIKKNMANFDQRDQENSDEDDGNQKRSWKDERTPTKN